LEIPNDDPIYLECGWICIKSWDDRYGYGTSGRFQISNKIYKEISNGVELATVIDKLSGRHDVRSNSGMMGVITKEYLTRDIAYSHGVMFAMAKFISGEQYWDPVKS